MLERSSTRYMVIVAMVDTLVTLASLKLAEVARFHLPFGAPPVALGIEIEPPLYVEVVAIWFFFLLVFGAYDAGHITNAGSEMRLLVAAALTSTMVFAGALFLTYRGLSRLMVFYFLALNVVGLSAGRLSLRWLAHKMTGGQRVHHVLIVGTNPVARQVARTVSSHAWMGVGLAGFLSVAQDGEAQDGQAGDPPVLGTLDEALSIVERYEINEIIISLPLNASPELPMVVSQLKELPVNIKVVPDFFDLVLFRASLEDFAGIPLIGLKEPVISGASALAKRSLDVFVSLLGLIVLSPLLMLVALVIRLDSPGTAIFRQQRVGQGGKLFSMYKFRTMVEDAEIRQQELIHHESDGSIIFRKMANDPRVTRVGRFLRRYSIDELPQLVNVLRGEMSLVGPRPELPSIVQSYRPWQRKRFLVPPGMTGWWQIRGRSQQPMHLRTEDDLYYIQNYSLLLDLQILWRTIGAVLNGRGAF